jgi:hypothetical protein
MGRDPYICSPFALRDFARAALRSLCKEEGERKEEINLRGTEFSVRETVARIDFKKVDRFHCAPCTSLTLPE